MLRTIRHYTWDSEVSLFSVGLMLLITGIMLWFQRPLKTSTDRITLDLCPEARSTENVVHQDVIPRLIEHYGDSPEQIKALLGPPLCSLPQLSIRTDTLTDRSVYQLESGQSMVVAYEDGKYVGHSLQEDPIPKAYSVQRSWAIQAGDFIGGYLVVASLGELSINMRGLIYAPESGTVTNQVTWISDDTTQSIQKGCVVFISPELPTYLSQLCGLKNIHRGNVHAKQVMAQVWGSLHFSLLTLRPDAQNKPIWQYVAPSPSFLAAFLGT